MDRLRVYILRTKGEEATAELWTYDGENFMWDGNQKAGPIEDTSALECVKMYLPPGLIEIKKPCEGIEAVMVG